MTTRTFIYIQIGLMALLIGGVWYPAQAWLQEGALPFMVFAIALSALSGLIAYLIVSNGIKKDIRMFTAYIMGSMLAKLMIGLLSITLIALKFKPFSAVYVLTYFFCYFIFTGFEVYALMRNLRPFSNKGQRSTHDENASH